jgi:protein CMS1
MSRTKQRARKQGKRKRAPDSDEDIESNPKRQQLKQPETRPLQNDFDASIATMDSQLLADLFVRSTKLLFHDKTSLELEDKYPPTKAFHDTSEFREPRNLQYLPLYLEKFAGGKEELMKNVEVATPHTLVVCSSGIRAADVARAVRVFHTDDSAIAKLFAKHLKLKKSIKYVKKTKISFGVGTPARLNDLLNAEAMSLRGLKRIVIDGSYLDEKKRTIFTMTDLFSPVIDLINREDIKSRYGDHEDSIQILVF